MMGPSSLDQPQPKIYLKEFYLTLTIARPFIIGINGIDGAGKTRFSNELSRFLLHRGCTVQLVHVDDFNNSKAFRYAGHDQAENYYYRSIDFESSPETSSTQ